MIKCTYKEVIQMRSNEEIVDILVNRMEQMNMSMSELARTIQTCNGL